MARVRSLLGGIALAGALLAAAAVALASAARGTLVLAPLVADGMVLQRDTRAAVAGTSRPGWPVVIAAGWGAVAVTRADRRGRWQASLATGAAGGPHRLLVWAGDVALVRDVVVGEVWLCAGQSNMAIPVAEDRPAVRLDVPAEPPIRLFRVAPAVADAPRATCDGRWRTADAAAAGGFSAACWHFGRALHAALGVPVGLVAAAAGGSAIEEWISARGFAPLPAVAAELRAANAVRVSDARPLSGYWNAMIAPLAPYALRGVVWYQGESNVPRARQYARLLPALIRDWRAWFGDDLAFGFVQLPGFAGYRPQLAIAELRDVQRRTLAVPGTGMVVSIDLGDPDDVHGASKAAIGLRLAAWALHRLHGRTDLPVAGPLYRRLTPAPGGLRVHFDHAAGGLAGPTPLPGFEVAGDDGVFHPAHATIAGETVVVRAAAVPAPTAVRYGWQDVPAAALRSRAGLPASPFRTDDWLAVPERLVARGEPRS